MYVDNSSTIEGSLRVWWIPQIPMEAFHRTVSDPAQAVFLMDALAQYDFFQYENNVKPDYSNAGGLEIFLDGEWEEWYDDEGDEITVWRVKNNAR
jgi:hypothetical protein